MCNCSIEFLLLTHTFFSIMQFSFFFFCSFLRPTRKSAPFFCTQKEKGNKRDQNSSHSSSLGASGHHHQPVAKRVLFGNNNKKNGQSTRSRSSRLVSSVARTRFFVGRCRRAFSVKNDEKGTTKDAKRRAPEAFEGRRDGKKSTARPREDSERIYRRHFFLGRRNN